VYTFENIFLDEFNNSELSFNKSTNVNNCFLKAG
ncbi:hypothetical protein, partial [Plasmodium yoelii yoelii]